MHVTSRDAHDQGADLMLDSLLLWKSISIGSFVQLDADLFDQEQQLLTRGRLYEVLAKVDGVSSCPVFVVESELTSELVELHPGLICNYLDNPETVHYA